LLLPSLLSIASDHSPVCSFRMIFSLLLLLTLLSVASVFSPVCCFSFYLDSRLRLGCCLCFLLLSCLL
jgi:hypothetical protein